MVSACPIAYLIWSHFYLPKLYLYIYIYIYTFYFLYLVYRNKTVYIKVTIGNITIITILTNFTLKIIYFELIF